MSILKKKAFAIIGGALTVAIITGGVATMYAKAAVKVNSVTISKSNMEQVIELNGNVASNDTDVFFAPTNLKVSKVYYKVGDVVKKGDLLVSFDEEDINNQIALLDLKAKENEGGYLNSIQTSDRYSALYSEAKRNLSVLDGQINEWQEKIINKQKEITDRSSELANEGAKLQVSIIDWSDKPDSDEYSNLQKLAQNNTYVQSYDEKLINLQQELARLQTELAGFKEYKAEMTSQKAQSYSGILTDGGREQLEAGKEATDLTIADEKEKYEIAKEGIKAQFDGVVSSVNAEEGSILTTGMEVISVDSIEDVCVKCNANKYDIMSIADGQKVNVNVLNNNYTGEVSRIEKIAGLSGANTGVGVDVKIDNPEGMILGLEVKAKVNTASLENIVSVPKSALVNEDDKYFVFVANSDKKAIKTSVEIGIQNDEYTEIVSGLNEGDIVVWSDSRDLNNGDDVRF
ncbi:MAG: efflux RND transporter periplasmic adaptor subunit [Lachnospiraceae bacterium]|nr:efflux RND transporter periplasmic adaptor subunit [Lachnospiraceae bacterium]